LFAGVALEGATLRQDLDDNATLYGKKLEAATSWRSECARRRPLRGWCRCWTSIRPRRART